MEKTDQIRKTLINTNKSVQKVAEKVGINYSTVLKTQTKHWKTKFKRFCIVLFKPIDHSLQLLYPKLFGFD